MKVLIVLVLIAVFLVFIVLPALIFTKVEKQKKLEAELERMRREQLS